MFAESFKLLDFWGQHFAPFKRTTAYVDDYIEKMRDYV